jgi:predicted deacylase
MVNAKMRDGSLRQAVAEQGIPMLLYESGEALRFDEFSIRTGVRGIISVMQNIGMLSSKAKRVKKTVLHTSTSKWVRAPISGIVSQRVPIGYQVAEGERIGLVSDPHDEIEQEVVAPVSGIVLGRLELPLVYQGDALFHIAVFEDDSEAGKLIEKLASELSQDDYRPWGSR